MMEDYYTKLLRNYEDDTTELAMLKSMQSRLESRIKRHIAATNDFELKTAQPSRRNKILYSRLIKKVECRMHAGEEALIRQILREEEEAKND
jgi:hypothetical protein